MKKIQILKIALAAMCLVLVISFLSSCRKSDTPASGEPSSETGSSDDVSAESSEPAEPESADEEQPEGQDGYEAIYEEYAAKLRAATPGLIEEYNAEAAQNTDGTEGLADICTEKISVLSNILNEGRDKMQTYMDEISGSYEEYQEWSDKLYNVYMEEADKITEVYMESAG